MDDVAKEIEDALKTDFPNVNLKHKPFTGNGKPGEPERTLSQQIDYLIDGLQGRIRVLEKLKATL